MDFHHTAERQMLADSLGRFLARRHPIETRHAISGSDAGWSAEQWAALAELGVPAVLISEAAGGLGGGGFDIAAVFEALGRSLVVGPSLGTLMAARALGKSGGWTSLLEDVCAGRAILAFAQAEPQGRYDLADVAAQARSDGGVWRLTGRKSVAPQLEAASHIVVSARVFGAPGDLDGLGLFLVDAAAPSAAIRGYPLIDGGRAGDLTLTDTPARLVAEDAAPLIEDAMAAGVVALCWEAVGVMDVMKSDTLDYLRTRRQFGVPIGKFQALQHRMADLAIEIEQARSAAINASAALDETRLRRERAVSAAKYTIGRVGALVAEETIQLHGGIGMTWELPLSHYAKRVVMIGHQLGDEDHHLARFIALGRAT